MITGEQIRAARKRAGYSQAELAKLVGVVQRTIGGWERGENTPGIAEPKLLAVLRDHLDTEVSEPPLRSVSDVELLAEIARRFARAEERERGERGGDTPATKAPGAGPGNVTELRLPPDADLDDLPDEADDPPPIGGGRQMPDAARRTDED